MLQVWSLGQRAYEGWRADAAFHLALLLMTGAIKAVASCEQSVWTSGKTCSVGSAPHVGALARAGAAVVAHATS